MYNSQTPFQAFIGKISEGRAFCFTSKFTGNIIDPSGGGKGYPFCHWHFLSPFQTSRRPYPLPSSSDPPRIFLDRRKSRFVFQDDLALRAINWHRPIDYHIYIYIYIYIYTRSFEIFMISPLFIEMQRDNFRFIGDLTIGWIFFLMGFIIIFFF